MKNIFSLSLLLFLLTSCSWWKMDIPLENWNVSIWSWEINYSNENSNISVSTWWINWNIDEIWDMNITRENIQIWNMWVNSSWVNIWNTNTQELFWNNWDTSEISDIENDPFFQSSVENMENDPFFNQGLENWDLNMWNWSMNSNLNSMSN